MAKRYKSIKIPIATYNKIIARKKRTEQLIKEVTGKTKRVPITKAIDLRFTKDIFLDNFEIKDLSGRRFKI